LIRIRQEIEFLRIVGAILIVLFHAKVGLSDVFYSGLVVFVILSVHLLKIEPIAHAAKKKYERLVVPWMFWFCAYGAFNFVLGRPIFSGNGEWGSAILAGTSIHLWYMPYIFLVGLTLVFVKSQVSDRLYVDVGWILAVALILTSARWRPYFSEFSYPWPQYMHALIGVAVGMFSVALVDKLNLRVVLQSLILIFACFWDLDVNGIGIPYFLGILLFFATVLLGGMVNIMDFRPGSRLTPGVYYTHIFVIAFVKKVGFHGVLLGFLSVLISFFLVYFSWKFAPNFSRRFL
jgi:hypothetical protein